VYLKNFPRVAPTTLAALLGALLFLEPLRGADLGTGAEEEAGPQAWQERQRHRYGQSGTVTGKVVTSDGSPVPGALVKILELNSKVTADQAGRFSFTDLPRQELTFTAEAPGFFPSTPVKLDLINKAEFELAITLVEKLPVTQSVVVTTGTGTEYVAVDAPVRTETITASKIERNVSRTLSEALTTTVPGVRVEYTCQNCGAPMIRLNGLEGAYTQILEDGLPTMSNLAMVYAVDQIPAEFFESIEVVKGGASALYGPNAVAGVINLIRKEPNYNLFQVDSQAGWHHGRPEESLGLAA
jgi:outer membrane receptor for ferrienterochelin and colicins